MSTVGHTQALGGTRREEPRAGETPDGVAALHDIVRRLRKALYDYAEPDEGWKEVEHADAYEASRELVPDDDEERASRVQVMP